LHLEQEVYLNLQRTAHKLSVEISNVLKPFDLTPSQYNVLRILRGAGDNGLSEKDAHDRLIIKFENSAEVFESLQDRGLTRQEKEGRITVLKILEKGLELLAKLDEPIMDRTKVILGHLEEDSLEQLNSLLVLARKRSGIS
jgi:DNA-binding MarR family transcriptional regulator